MAGCGGRLSSSTDGVITSPGFPTSLYDASSNCTWIITASRPGVRPLSLVLTKLLVLIYYDGKQCLDRVVCILLVSFNILILSVFFFISIGLQCMHVFCVVLADGLYCICILHCNQSSLMATTDKSNVYLLTNANHLLLRTRQGSGVL